MTLAAGQNARLPLALGAALGTGALVGAINALLVVRLWIAAMNATLAMDYILATATLIVNPQVRGFETAPLLCDVAAGRLGTLPNMALVALAATAQLAGIRTGRVVTASFVVSGLTAALAGALLSAYAGGAFLDMDSPYLLQSVGAGSLIFGGCSTAVGTLLGAFLLILVVSTMQIWGLPTDAQDIVQGVLIIAVLAFAGAGSLRRM